MDGTRKIAEVEFSVDFSKASPECKQYPKEAGKLDFKFQLPMPILHRDLVPGKEEQAAMDDANEIFTAYMQASYGNILKEECIIKYAYHSLRAVYYLCPHLELGSLGAWDATKWWAFALVLDAIFDCPWVLKLKVTPEDLKHAKKKLTSLMSMYGPEGISTAPTEQTLESLKIPLITELLPVALDLPKNIGHHAKRISDLPKFAEDNGYRFCGAFFYLNEFDNGCYPYTLDTVRFMRSHVCTAPLVCASAAVIIGVCLSESVLNHVCFHRLLQITADFAGCFNDLGGLQKDIDNGEPLEGVIGWRLRNGQSPKEAVDRELARFGKKFPEFYHLRDFLVSRFPEEGEDIMKFSEVLESYTFGTVQMHQVSKFYTETNNIKITVLDT